MLLLILFLLAACSREDRAFVAMLDRADSLMQTHPDSALALLDAAGSQGAKEAGSQGVRKTSLSMRYWLLKADALNKTDRPMPSDTVMQEVVDYYDRHGNTNERMRAHYLLGRVYHDMGEAPMALECYQQAAEQADTTKADCDLHVLHLIYGQMADLYYYQYLPDDEMQALKNCERIAWKEHDTIPALIAYELRLRPYYQKNDTDSVLYYVNTSYQLYKKYGYNKEASIALNMKISTLVNRHKWEEVRKYMDIFERESGLFDKEGNIQIGRELYYRYRGCYLLGIGNPDSALYWFNRVLSYGYTEAGYKGLLDLYKQKKIPDSIAKYAELFAKANDDSYLENSMELVSKQTQLYNYERNRRKAEQSSYQLEIAKTHNILLAFVVLVVGNLLIVLYFVYRARQKKLLVTISSLSQEYAEVQRLMSAEKQEIASTLQSRIDDLQERLKRYSESQLRKAFYESESYRTFFSHKETYHIKDKLTEDQWESLRSVFSQHFHQFFQYINLTGGLNQEQKDICMLLMIGFKEGEIGVIMDIDSQRVNRLKSQTNHRLFGEDSAKTLKQNLLTRI